MKNFKLKKLVAVALVAMTIATVSPIGATAAWKQDSNGWWNTKANSWSTGWESIDGSWYYFGSNGYMKTGWADDNGTWYFMQPSGAMQTGWINDGGKWYYTAPSGAMKTGWVNDGGTWYFTAASGAMQTGVVEVDGKVYYLAPSGAMATGAVTIGGVTYTFAASGEAIGDKIPTPTVAFTSAGTAVTPTKTTSTGTDTTTTTSSSGGGGGSSSGGGSPTTEKFQEEINRLYQKYADHTVNADFTDDSVTLSVVFDQQVDNSKTGDDFVTQDVFVTNADGTDADITYNSTTKQYTAKVGAKVYISVRVYRNGQIAYVTTTPYTAIPEIN